MSHSTSERILSHWAMGSILVALLLLLLASRPPAMNGTAQARAIIPTALPTASPAVPSFHPELPTPTPPAALVHIAAPLSSPVPTTPVPDPEAPRIGIQIGHWLSEEVPEELEPIRTMLGIKVDEADETIINEQIAHQLAGILRSENIVVDILPATVPEGYSADLFLALHVDSYKDRSMRGFKVVRSHWSDNVERDDTLVGELIVSYEAATGMPEHAATISDNMTEYYAFNYGRFRNSIAPSTPGLIIEMGFLSNDEDRWILTSEQDRVVRGIAGGVLPFLGAPR